MVKRRIRICKIAVLSGEIRTDAAIFLDQGFLYILLIKSKFFEIKVLAISNVNISF